MKCPRTQTLSAYLERELGPAKTAAVQSHVEGCSACQRELRALETLTSGLRKLPADTFSLEDYGRLVGLATRTAHRPVAPAGYRPALAIAAAMALSFGIGFLGSNLYHRSVPGPEPVAPGLQAYLSDHRGYETLLSAETEFNVQVALTE